MAVRTYRDDYASIDTEPPSHHRMVSTVATFLSSVGRFCFRRRGLVVLLWVLALAGMGFAASSAPPPPADTFSMPGTESQQAFDLLQKKFPDARADGAAARVVVRAPGTDQVTSPARKAGRALDRASGLEEDRHNFQGVGVSAWINTPTSRKLC